MAKVKMIARVAEDHGALTVKELYDKLGKFIEIGYGNRPVELDFSATQPPAATTVMLAGKAVRINNLRR